MATTDEQLNKAEEVLAPYDLPDVVIVSKSDYNGLIQDQNVLRALEGAGVDNWDGYDYAMENV